MQVSTFEFFHDCLKLTYAYFGIPQTRKGPLFEYEKRRLQLIEYSESSEFENPIKQIVEDLIDSVVKLNFEIPETNSQIIQRKSAERIYSRKFLLDLAAKNLEKNSEFESKILGVFGNKKPFAFSYQPGIEQVSQILAEEERSEGSGSESESEFLGEENLIYDLEPQGNLEIEGYSKILNEKSPENYGMNWSEENSFEVSKSFEVEEEKENESYEKLEENEENLEENSPIFEKLEEEILKVNNLNGDLHIEKNYRVIVEQEGDVQVEETQLHENFHGDFHSFELQTKIQSGGDQFNQLQSEIQRANGDLYDGVLQAAVAKLKTEDFRFCWEILNFTGGQARKIFLI